MFFSLFSLASQSYTGANTYGLFMRPGITLALEDIANDPTMNSLFTIQAYDVNEECSALPGVNAFLSLKQKYNIHAMIGPQCSGE